MMPFTPAYEQRTRGTVLIVTMWVVLVLAGLVLVFTRAMRVEGMASANYVATRQAEAVARGALRLVVASVADGNTALETMDWEAVEVGDGYFWVLRPDDDDNTFAFGIVDEAARLNLNSATQDMLLKLPNMTLELAAAIVDWRDRDSEISSGGAEREYYLLLDDPYDCKNAAFETVDELLLVRGASTDILAGEDANRNGVLDDNENDSDASEPADNRDGDLDLGLYDFVTVHSREANTDSSGQQRINVNSASTTQLGELVKGVVADARYYQIMENVRNKRPFDNIIVFAVNCGLTYDEFKQIADRLTTTNQEERVGLINVNTAAKTVLMCLPGLEESDANALIAKRTASDVDLTSVAWVMDALKPEKAVAIGGAITVQSHQYSADIVAVSGNGRGWKRYRAVIDALESPPKVLFWKDLTHLGWPLDSKILEAVRAGKTPDDVD